MTLRFAKDGHPVVEVEDGNAALIAYYQGEGFKPAAPAKNALKDEWVAFAESQGDTDAASKTRDELIEQYGA